MDYVKTLAAMLGAKSGIGNLLEGLVPGKECPFCGEEHVKKTEDAPEVPEYEESSGMAGEYEFTPRPLAAIQLLPDNPLTAMKFMLKHEVPFVHCANKENGATGNKGVHFHVINPAEDDEPFEHWDLGEWLVVENAKDHPDFEYYVYSDDYFRRQCRKVDSPTVAEAVNAFTWSDNNTSTWNDSTVSDVLDVEEDVSAGS